MKSVNYELLFLVGESKEADLEKIKSDVERIVTEEGGEFLEEEMIEKRKMAYEIQKEQRGTYIAKRFKTPSKDEREEKEMGNILSNITRKMNLNNDVMRFILVKTDELPELSASKKEGEKVSNRKAQEAKDAKPKRGITKKSKPVRREVERKPKEKIEEKPEEKKTEEKPEEKKVEEKPAKKVEKKPKKKEESKEGKSEDKKEKKEEKKNEADEKDIDKKLDEILNI